LYFLIFNFIYLIEGEFSIFDFFVSIDF